MNKLSMSFAKISYFCAVFSFFKFGMSRLIKQIGCGSDLILKIFDDFSRGDWGIMKHFFLMIL